MQHKLFFPLSVSEKKTRTESPKPHTPDDKELVMKPITKTPSFKRTTGKRQSKISGNNLFQSVCSWISKGIWTGSLALSSNFCFAANADGYAFTGALFNIMMELKGAPIAIICAIGIIAAGFFWIFKGHDVGLKQVVAALIGGGLVIAAPTLITMVPGMTGAVI